MIVFDNVALESIAPVMIEDIRVGPIELNPVTRPRGINAGSEFVRMRGGTRTVAITFGLLVDDRAQRQNLLSAISEWAKTDKEYRLTLPLYPDRYLECVCTAKPEPSYRQWWESKLRIVFTCYSNPYWTASTEKSAACGTDFFVLGDAPPLMRIFGSIAEQTSNLTYGNTQQTMIFSTVPAGYINIKLNEQTAEVNNNSIMQYYRTESQFIIPRYGAEKITGIGTVFYRERWQ